MNIILLGLTALAITLVAGPVLLVSAGIRRQERAGSLTSQPSGLLAVLAARILGLRTSLPGSLESTRSGARSSAPVRRPAASAGPVRS